jgi:hypothetical protein
MNTETRWKQIVGFPGYAVSDAGDVRSPRREALRGHKNRYGYPTVCLYRDGKYKTLRVHRLVLEAFCGPCPPGMQGRHLDGNRSNNHITNLSWGTRSENEGDKWGHGTRLIGVSNHSAKLNPVAVMVIRWMHAKHGVSRKRLAGAFGMSREAVRKAIISGWAHVPSVALMSEIMAERRALGLTEPSLTDCYPVPEEIAHDD